MLEGKGRLSFSNGDWYEGDFVNGMFHGDGTFYSREGETETKGSWYQGEYVDGYTTEACKPNSI